MEQQSPETRDRTTVPPGTGVDRVIGDAPAYTDPGSTRYRAFEPGTEMAENVMPVRDRVQWGPIIAGAVVALASLIVLAVLGVAIGASAFEPGTDLTDWGTGAGIYGAISMLIALFVGGLIAAKTAAVDGPFAGIMNGLLAGATAIVALIVLSSLGLSNVLGFLGANLQNVANYAGEIATGEAAADEAQGAFDNIADGAWGTLIALLLALGAAALGGFVGHNKRADLVYGTGRDA